MIVCQCRAVTDREVRSAALRGAENLADLARETGAGTDCCGCREHLASILDDARAAARTPPPGERRLVVVAA